MGWKGRCERPHLLLYVCITHLLFRIDVPDVLTLTGRYACRSGAQPSPPRHAQRAQLNTSSVCPQMCGWRRWRSCALSWQPEVVAVRLHNSRLSIHIVNSSIAVCQSPQADVVATKRTTCRQREWSATGSQGTSYVLHYEVRNVNQCVASLTAGDQSALILKMSQQITDILSRQHSMAVSLEAVCASLGIVDPPTDTLSVTS